MASLNRNWYAPSPTMLAQPPVQQPPNYFDQDGCQFSISNSPPKPFSSAQPASSNLAVPTRPHAAGRKRSRDEISGMLEEPSLARSTLDRPPSPPKKPVAEPIYGPGMSLIYPDDPGLTVDAASQSGTWVEERAEATAYDSKELVAQPDMESRKAQRLNGDAPGLDDIAKAVMSTPRKSVSEPTIDEATRTLGIGWIEMSDTMEAATRGWVRFIENHYPLESVTIFWQNKALPAYLAQAVCYGSPGYYLFDEALDRCQLVAKSWERALDNLRASPPVFDGGQILTARRSMVSKGDLPAAALESGMEID